MTLTIGSIDVNPGLALAPMAGITDHPFRLLAREQGCPLLYTEMISAKGLIYNPGRQKYLLCFTDEERQIGFQIFGSDPLIMAQAAQKLETLGADFIDLNFGCPTPKITRNGEGGALLCRSELASEIFKTITGAVACPVTVKLRKGWDEQNITVLDIAARAEEAGLKAVTVHGRTVQQGYKGRADWSIIRQVKENLSIPVIGNGDIDSSQSAKEMFRYCGCNGVMVGRAAQGNPWIFKEILAGLKNKPLPEKPSVKEIVEMVLKHLAMLSDLKGEAAAVREMRSHASWYIRELPGAAAARRKLVQTTSAKETEGILREFCHTLKHL